MDVRFDFGLHGLPVGFTGLSGQALGFLITVFILGVYQEAHHRGTDVSSVYVHWSQFLRAVVDYSGVMSSDNQL